jgi:hypothetical protein
MIEDRALRTHAITHAAALVDAEFTWTRMAERNERIYEGLVAPVGPRGTP